PNTRPLHRFPAAPEEPLRRPRTTASHLKSILLLRSRPSQPEEWWKVPASVGRDRAQCTSPLRRLFRCLRESEPGPNRRARECCGAYRGMVHRVGECIRCEYHGQLRARGAFYHLARLPLLRQDLVAAKTRLRTIARSLLCFHPRAHGG